MPERLTGTVTVIVPTGGLGVGVREQNPAAARRRAPVPLLATAAQPTRAAYLATGEPKNSRSPVKPTWRS